ncbi:MAG: DUF1559 domain-containing protein [Pirellulales bacterium]|nr:DUF1559 domain-containing protein [Pirellulales bacterium]
MQFTLRTLLVLFVAVSSTLAIGGPWAIVGLIYVIALVMSIRLAVVTKWTEPATHLVVVGLVFLAIWWFFVPLVTATRTPSRRSICYSNLKTLGIALNNYHNAHKSFPPAYVTDPDGKPLYSWRVLLLPHLECHELYQAFRLDEPWDSPHNLKLAEKMPYVFHCPTADHFHGENRITTDYVAVVGPGTAWPGAKGSRLEDFTDGPENTLLLVEIGDSDIPWTAPFDPTLAEVLSTEKSNHRVPSSGHFPEQGMIIGTSGNVLLADESTDFWPGHPNRDDFQAALTIAGGEKVDLETMPHNPPVELRRIPLMPDPSFTAQVVAGVILLLSLAYLLTRPLPPVLVRWAEERTTKGTKHTNRMK